jgi:hypothetical protein
MNLDAGDFVLVSRTGIITPSRMRRKDSARGLAAAALKLTG